MGGSRTLGHPLPTPQGTLCYFLNEYADWQLQHNICIDHGLHWEETDFTTEEDDTIDLPHAATPSGILVRQPVVETYFDEILPYSSDLLYL